MDKCTQCKPVQFHWRQWCSYIILHWLHCGLCGIFCVCGGCWLLNIPRRAYWLPFWKVGRVVVMVGILEGNVWVCSEDDLLTVDMKCLRKISQDYRVMLLFHGNMQGNACSTSRAKEEKYWIVGAQQKRSLGCRRRERTDLPLEDGCAVNLTSFLYWMLRSCHDILTLKSWIRWICLVFRNRVHVFLTRLSPDLIILSCFGIAASVKQRNIKRKK